MILYIPISKSQKERESVSHQSYSGKSHLKQVNLYAGFHRKLHMPSFEQQDI